MNGRMYVVVCCVCGRAKLAPLPDHAAPAWTLSEWRMPSHGYCPDCRDRELARLRQSQRIAARREATRLRTTC